VLGEVVRPATYEMKAGETVADLIRDAGGFTAAASRRRVQIERIIPPEQRTEAGRDRTMIDVTSDGYADGEGPVLSVQAGDVVRVFPVSERVRNRISVVGNVWTPGAQGFVPGMHLSDALRGAGGVKPDVYLGQVLISRLRPDSTRVQLHAALRDTTGAAVEDLPLAEDDEVQVFSVRTFRPRRYVAIVGAVRSPGRFPYREGMTVRDLALLAGGLQESAYLKEAEVARLPDDRSDGVTATTFRVPLDSSYLFERGADGRYLGPPGLPAGRGDAPEVPVKPYDNVLILRQPDWELQRTVTIAGEVRFPGRYALQNKSERLRDLIRRAGGLTRESYPEGVYFYRRQKQLGRIGIDLPQAMRDARDRDNLILQDGDSIFVPVYSNVVNVAGAVNSPVAVSYVRGKNLDYYIGAAGGGSRKADLRRAYVTQPNGKVESVSSRPLFPDGVPQPRPGSSIYVPEKDPADKRDYSAALGAAAQILASLVAIVVVLRRK
jgi:protein involved in polysaccharide export with SLBB domain